MFLSVFSMQFWISVLSFTGSHGAIDHFSRKFWRRENTLSLFFVALWKMLFCTSFLFFIFVGMSGLFLFYKIKKFWGAGSQTDFLENHNSFPKFHENLLFFSVSSKLKFSNFSWISDFGFIIPSFKKVL